MSTPRCSQAAQAQQFPRHGDGRAARWVYLGVRGLGRAADLLLTWQERAHQRRHLESLNDHMLRDIGLSRADVIAEATKPFWER